LVIRIFWIFPVWAHRLSGLEKTLLVALAVVLFSVAVRRPISSAYMRRNGNNESKNENPQQPQSEEKGTQTPPDAPPAITPAVKPIPKAHPFKKPSMAPSHVMPGTGPTENPPAVFNNSPGSAFSVGQQGGITAGTYNAGPPPPTFTLETINKNSQEGPDSFRTEYQLDVTTTTPLSLYVRAQATDIGSKMRMQPCLQVLRLRNGFASGNMRDVISGAGFCEGHVSEVTSGRYQIVVFTTKAEDVQLTYQPD